MRYDEVADAVGATGMVARGGFAVTDGENVPACADGSPTRSVVIIGNVGGAMWPAFRAAEQAVPDPLDAWTRAQLTPIAEALRATFVHPSDEPFQPFQRWAQRAEEIDPSPIGILVHPEFGLWHAYRGAFLFPVVVDGLPDPVSDPAPCLACEARPCLSSCPVGAFTDDAYDVEACRGHVHSRAEPACLADGCAARLACPIGVSFRYGPDQMRFHMRAFAG